MLITQSLLRDVAAEAAASPRRRKNRNFHTSDAAAAHRLLNAIEPDSYVQPHRHLDPAKSETIIAVRGRLGIVLFTEGGSVESTVVIAPASEVIGIDVPSGRFHTVLALETGSVFFEAKAGPYVPIAPGERAAWAPAEGEPGAADAFASYRALFGEAS